MDSKIEIKPYLFERNVQVICVEASSFPDGILSAHQSLHQTVPFSKNRRYFGISKPNKSGAIIYKAAAELLMDEDYLLSELETFKIPKGRYLSVYISDYQKDLSQISKTFDHLLKEPALDPKGFCLELYTGQHDVLCMVPMLNN